MSIKKYANAEHILPRELLKEVQKHHSGILWIPAPGSFYKERRQLVRSIAKATITDAEAKEDIADIRQRASLIAEELEEIEQSLKKQIQPFVEYDIQATQKWIDKLPPIPKKFSRPKRIGERAETPGMYV